jgi:hypothetical protein
VVETDFVLCHEELIFTNNTDKLSPSKLKRLVAGISPQSPGIDLQSVLVRLMLEKWHWPRVYANDFGIPCWCRPTCASYSSSTKYYYIRKDKWATPVNLHTKHCSFAYRGVTGH